MLSNVWNKKFPTKVPFTSANLSSNMQSIFTKMKDTRTLVKSILHDETKLQASLQLNLELLEFFQNIATATTRPEVYGSPSLFPRVLPKHGPTGTPVTFPSHLPRLNSGPQATARAGNIKSRPKSFFVPENAGASDLVPVPSTIDNPRLVELHLRVEPLPENGSGVSSLFL